MDSSKGVICFGELVVDCFGNIKDGFVPKFGGAPGNTAIGLCQLGVENVYMHAMVGHDFFGDFLVDVLHTRGVDTRGVGRHIEKKTTLAFVSLAADGQRSFVFYEGAHPHVDRSILDESLFAQSTIFHFGSLAQATPEGRATTDEALALARKHRLTISYDPNVREALWRDHDELRRIIKDTIPKTDILKINEEEALFLAGSSDPKTAAQTLWHDSLSLLIITVGPKGAWYKTQQFSGMVETINVTVVDTTGAGDACNAGLLSQLRNYGQDVRVLSEEDIRSAVRFGVVFASLSTTQKGAVEALPTYDQVTAHLA